MRSNKKQFLVFFVLITLALYSNHAAADETVTHLLKVKNRRGEAPLTVCIIGPREVAQRFEECVYSFGWYGWSGNGIDLSWGDGTTPGQRHLADRQRKSCTQERCHTYRTPGKYTVELKLWHPGPTDRTVTDWRGKRTVYVR